jgi:tetratricopeptide (TPR) repeat protein
MQIKLVVGLVGLLSPVVFLTAGSGAPDDFQQLIKQAHGALTKFDLDSARAKLNQACAIPATSADGAICEAETGAIEEASGHTNAAELHYRHALALWEQLAPEHAAYRAATLVNLASIYRLQNRPAEAEDVLTQALDAARQTTIGHDQVLAVAVSRLGGFYSESAAPDRGRPLLNQAISLLRTQPISNPAELAYAYNSLGMLDLSAGDYKGGESNLREAVSVAERALGESHPDTALYQANLGLALYSEGQYDRAELLLKRARHIIESRLPAGSSRLGTILADLTAVEAAEGQYARAEADAAQSLAILSHRGEPDSAEIAVEKVTLATIYLRERKISEAAKILPDVVALERRLASAGPDIARRILADGIRRLGELRALEHNWTEAQTLYGEAIGIYESTIGSSHPGMAPVLREYADVLRHSGAPKTEVKNIESRARAIKT